MRFQVVAATALTLVIGAEGLAQADERAASQLSYVAVQGCPDARSFRDQVAARLGYDPFVAGGAAKNVKVDFTRSNGRLEGRAEIFDGGSSRGTRVLTGDVDKCEPLATALATTVAIALDPEHALSAPAAPTPPPPSSDVAPPPTPVPSTVVVVHDVERRAEPAPVEAPPPRDRAPIALAASAAMGMTGAMGPGPTIGPELGIAVRSGSYSIEALGRVDTTIGSPTSSLGDRLDATVITGGLAPCGHIRDFALCVVAKVGSFQSRAPDVVSPYLATSLFAAAGLRASYSIPLGAAVGLRAGAELGIPLVRTSLAIDRGDVWTAPPVFVGFTVGMTARFL